MEILRITGYTSIMRRENCSIYYLAVTFILVCSGMASAMDPHTVREASVATIAQQHDFASVAEALLDIAKLGQDEDVEFLHRIVSSGEAYASLKDAGPILTARFFLEVSELPTSIAIFSKFLADATFMSNIERASAVLGGVARLR